MHTRIPRRRTVHVEHVMGTVVSVDLRSPGPVGDALVRAVDGLHEADRAFSTFRPDSAINRIDRGELDEAEAPPDVRRVLRRCEEMRRWTGGAFDERASGRLDPSALVKGRAVQQAADALVAGGASALCICAGGDVVCVGEPAPGVAWRVGIQHPRDRSALAAVVELRDRAIATSGSYERGQHIRDPRDGAPPSGVLSVSVIGPDLGTADALSTAAFALGADAAAFTMTMPRGYDALTIVPGDRMLATPGFPDGPQA